MAALRTCAECGTPATSPWGRFCVKCGSALPGAIEPVSSAEVPAAAWAPPARTSGAAVTALVLGIVAFVLWFFGIALAPVAIILGVAGRRRVREAPSRYRGSGMATAGLVLGLVWMILATAIVSGLVAVRLSGTQ